MLGHRGNYFLQTDSNNFLDNSNKVVDYSVTWILKHATAVVLTVINNTGEPLGSDRKYSSVWKIAWSSSQLNEF